MLPSMVELLEEIEHIGTWAVFQLARATSSHSRFVILATLPGIPSGPTSATLS
jgi:hypothetical protein